MSNNCSEHHNSKMHEDEMSYRQRKNGENGNHKKYNNNNSKLK